MAIETAHGDQVDLGLGVIRSYVKLADLSSLSELVAAVPGYRIRPVAGMLDLSAAGQFEIKSDAKKCHYGRLAGAGQFTFGDGVVLPGELDQPLSIEASVAMTCDGWVEWTLSK